MTMRLSHSSLTGTERTEVAVGTVERDVHVLGGAGRRAAQHGVGRLVAGRRRARPGATPSGTGLVVPLAGSAALVSGRGLATGAGVGVGSRRVLLGRRGAASVGGLRGRRWARPSPGVAAVRPSPLPPLACPFVLKYVAHVASTLPGSRWYWSYISSTSHSLAPKSADGELGLATWGLRHGLIRLFRYVRGGVSVVKARPPHQQMQTAGRRLRRGVPRATTSSCRLPSDRHRRWGVSE